MAAIVRHAVFKTRPIPAQKHIPTSAFATKAEKRKGIDRKVPPKIEWTAQSLASKGFLRSQKEYSPPADVKDKIDTILNEKLNTIETDADLGDLKTKFEVLKMCAEEFQHSVPNSQLHTIRSVGDLRSFYVTPVCTKTPFDTLKEMDLPPNLHVQQDYIRFHPDTDTKFNGRTAFPRSSTLVTGLKYRGKYKGHTQAQEWPFNVK